MRFDPERHHRRSIRLPGYDYAQAGGYFVTIVGAGMPVWPGGKWRNAVERWWVELGNKYPTAVPDVCVVMPNHFHGIVIITGASVGAVGADPPVGANLRVCPNEGEGAHVGAPLPDIPRMVQWFKTMTTNEYIRGVKTLGWTSFPGQLWQRNCHEHVIRNGESLQRIRE